MDIKIILSSKVKNLLDDDKITFISDMSKTIIEVDEEHIIVRGNNAFCVEQLIFLIGERSGQISQDEIRAIYLMSLDKSRKVKLPGLGEEILPKSAAQSRYIHLIKTKDIVFASGVAGTGKTHLAAAMGLNALMTREVDRLVLSRPAVEAGEKLGFLPGDLKEKIDPYLRPLYDELLIWIQPDILDRYISQNKIEIAPLAYMRGRTFRNSWIILDEAQNTTVSQMKMFLTRFGNGSKMIVTGDESQLDINKSVRSGLRDAIPRLKGIPGIGFVHFDGESIVRHPIIKHIIDAYERNE